MSWLSFSIPRCIQGVSFQLLWEALSRKTAFSSSVIQVSSYEPSKVPDPFQPQLGPERAAASCSAARATNQTQGFEKLRGRKQGMHLQVFCNVGINVGVSEPGYPAFLQRSPLDKGGVSEPTTFKVCQPTIEAAYFISR